MGESIVDTLVDENMMGDSGAAVGNLQVSVSFGRFENDSLSWDKWSSFSQNKYLEEVEKCATPGSVAEKKAYFEAHYKKIAARKAEIEDQQKQFETSLLRSEAPTNGDLIENTTGTCSEFHASDGQRSAEEVKEVTKLIGELSSNNVDEQPQVDAADELEEEIDLFGELSSTSVDEQPQVDAAEEVKEEINLFGVLSGTNVDDKRQVDADVANHSSSIEGERELKCTPDSSEIEKEEDKFVLVEEEATPKGALSIVELPQNRDNESGNTSKFKENVKLELQKSSRKAIAENKERNVARANKTPVSSIQKSPQVSSPRLSSSTKKGKDSSMSRSKNSAVMSRSAFTSAKTPVSRSSTRKGTDSSISRSKNLAAMSTPSVTSVSRSSTKKGNESSISRSKNSAVMSRPELTPTVTSITRSATTKGTDSSILRNKNLSAGGSSKPAPTALHMSLSFSPQNADDPAPVPAIRKSLFLEKMGDKDIVKRAFKTFQNNVHQSKPSSEERDSVPNQVLKNKTELRPSSSVTTQKEKERLHKTSGTGEKSAKTALYFSGLRSDEKLEKRFEFSRKHNEKSNVKEAEGTHLRSKSKEGKEADIKKLRQNFNFKATPLPGFYRGQNLSKSLRDKEGGKNGLHH